MSSANVYFVEFEQVNIYLRKFDVWSLKLFDSFILIHFDCVRGMVSSFIRFCLSRFGFWFFKLKWKTKNKLQIWILMFSYFKNRKNHLFWCFLPKLEYRNENQNYISYFIFQFIKKMKWHFGYTDFPPTFLDGTLRDNS